VITDEVHEKKKADEILKPLNSAEELRDWIYVYLDMYMPLHHIEEDSNSSSVEAMWVIYKAARDNTGDAIPGYIMLSARDSYKTLSAAMLEILLLIHFRTTIAHCSAILSQSAKAVEYCDTFIHKVLPYLEHHNWKLTSTSKSKIELRTDKKEKCYIQIIVLTTRGANSAHTRFLFIDEVDLCDPSAYEEAKMIPGVQKGQYPITVRLSTRKYSFGLMQKALKDAPAKNEAVLRWNLLDVAAYCEPSRCRPTEPRVARMIPRQLPLRQLSVEDFEDVVDDTEKSEWERIEAFAGCVSCSLLSVCKTRLHTVRTPDQTGDLWKPIPAVINTIKQVEPDTGEAQLRCNKPSTKGLVFPRFTDENIVSLDEAWEILSGDPPTERVTLDALVAYVHELGLPLYAGMDYGYTANHAMVVGALLPDGTLLVLDCYSLPGLELEDIKKLVKEWQDKYKINEWYPDPAYPAYNKTLRKIIPLKKFTKDVPMGIEAVRGIVLTSGNTRKMKIVRTQNNMVLIDGFGVYHWKLHPVTKVPTDVLDDTGDEADILDAFRYLCQNRFAKTGHKPAHSHTSDHNRQAREEKRRENMTREEVVADINSQMLYQGVRALPSAPPSPEAKDKKGKGVHWNF
jgi:hypothetical protein